MYFSTHENSRENSMQINCCDYCTGMGLV